MSLRIVELNAISDLEALRSPWRELAMACSHDTPYVLPEFLLPWIRRLGDRCQCRFLAAWEGDVLVGLAPMVERRLRRLGVDALALLGFPDAPPTPPCDLLVRPGYSHVTKTFLDHWTASVNWDVIVFPVVPVESECVRHLAELARSRHLVVDWRPILETYHVPLEGSWESFHAKRTKKTRQNLRRGLHFFQQQGSTRFAIYPGDMTRAEASAALLHVLARSWKDHEAGEQGWNAFLRTLINELGVTESMEITVLWLDRDPVAYLLEIPYKNVQYAIHNGYDLRYQTGNAGQLILAHAIERAYRRGMTRYDFTGDKDYLRRWTKTTRQFVQLRIRRRSPLAALKLCAYDWLRERRVRAVRAGTEQAKVARKLGARQPEDEPDDA